MFDNDHLLQQQQKQNVAWGGGLSCGRIATAEIINQLLLKSKTYFKQLA